MNQMKTFESMCICLLTSAWESFASSFEMSFPVYHHSVAVFSIHKLPCCDKINF